MKFEFSAVVIGERFHTGNKFKLEGQLIDTITILHKNSNQNSLVELSTQAQLDTAEDTFH